jgi:hypothetical protein
MVDVVTPNLFGAEIVEFCYCFIELKMVQGKSIKREGKLNRARTGYDEVR